MNRVHKAIVASGSQYFLEKFKNLKKEDWVPEPADGGADERFIEIPQPIKTKSCADKSSDEHVNRILKYIYNN